MKLVLLSMLAMPTPFFSADCPVMKMAEILPGQPEPVCLFLMADCTNGATPPDFVYGNCASDVCECLNSDCDRGEEPDPDPVNPDPVDPDPVDPDPVAPDPVDPGSPTGPGSAAQAGPASSPVQQPVDAAETATFELGASRQFDDRRLRPNQALESKAIRLPNTKGQDPATDLIKVPKQIRVDLITNVRFGAGGFFPQDAFYGLFELRTTAPLTYKVNDVDVTIPVGKKFHIALRLKEQPATLSNLGRSYRALVRSDSSDSPQEGVITLSDVEYHAIGSK